MSRSGLEGSQIRSEPATCGVRVLLLIDPHRCELEHLFRDLLLLLSGNPALANHLLSALRDDLVVPPGDSSGARDERRRPLRICHGMDHLDAEGSNDFKGRGVPDEPVQHAAVDVPGLFDGVMLAIVQNVDQTDPGRLIQTNLDREPFAFIEDETANDDGVLLSLRLPEPGEISIGLERLAAAAAFDPIRNSFCGSDLGQQEQREDD